MDRTRRSETGFAAGLLLALAVAAIPSIAAADDAGYPVVVKPLAGNHGRGVSINLNADEEVEVAEEHARARLARAEDERAVALDARGAEQEEPEFGHGSTSLM